MCVHHFRWPAKQLMVVVFILKFIQGISRTLLLASRTSFMEAIPAKMFGGAGPEHRSSPTPSVTCFGFAFNHGIQREVGRCPCDQRVLYTAQSRNHEPTRVIIQPGSSTVKGHKMRVRWTFFSVCILSWNLQELPFVDWTVFEFFHFFFWFPSLDVSEFNLQGKPQAFWNASAQRVMALCGLKAGRTLDGLSVDLSW